MIESCGIVGRSDTQSGQIRQLLRGSGGRGRGVGVVRAARYAPPRMRSRAQAAPLHRPCWWRGWCPVWAVARCPLAWPQRPAVSAFDRTGAARGGLTKWGRWLASWWGGCAARARPKWGAPRKTRRAVSGKGRGLPGCGVGVRSGGACGSVGGSVKVEGIAPAKPAHQGQAGGWPAGQAKGKAKGKAKDKRRFLYM
jgi:hypothetical protein